MVVNGKETQFPVPEPCLPLNFLHSTGMCYEAEEVRQCLLKGEVTLKSLDVCTPDVIRVDTTSSYEYQK